MDLYQIIEDSIELTNIKEKCLRRTYVSIRVSQK